MLIFFVLEALLRYKFLFHVIAMYNPSASQSLLAKLGVNIECIGPLSNESSPATRFDLTEYRKICHSEVSIEKNSFLSNYNLSAPIVELSTLSIEKIRLKSWLFV